MELSKSVKALQYLGLSNYEARVYASLIFEGISNATDLSVKCDVPRTKIYSTLNKLIEKGLVFELPGKPRNFTPISPIEAFQHELLRSKEETSNKVISLVESREAVSLLEEYYKKTQLIDKPLKEEVWIFHSKTNIIKKIREILSTTKKKVIVITTEEGLIFFDNTYNKLLDKLVEKGVHIQIGAPINERNASLIRELRYICEVKQIDFDLPLLILFIDDEVFFLVKLNTEIKHEKNIGLFCVSPNLHDLFSILLSKLDK